MRSSIVVILGFGGLRLRLRLRLPPTTITITSSPSGDTIAGRMWHGARPALVASSNVHPPRDARSSAERLKSLALSRSVSVSAPVPVDHPATGPLFFPSSSSSHRPSRVWLQQIPVYVTARADMRACVNACARARTCICAERHEEEAI